VTAARIVAVLALFAGVSVAQTVQSPSSARVMRVFHRSLRNSTRDVDRVTRELAALGPDAIAPLFEIAAGETSELAGEQTLHPARLESASELARMALGRMRERDVLLFLDGLVDDDSSPEVRLAAVRVLGDRQSSQALERLLDLGREYDPRELSSHAVRRTFQASLTRILSGNGSAWDRLGDELKSVGRPMLDWVVNALVQSGNPRSFEALPMLLGRDPGLDPLILTALSDLAERRPWLVEDELASAVTPFLDDEDWRLRKFAVVALGRIHSVDDLDQIAFMLEDEHPAVQRAARWSLEEMAGDDHGSTRGEWLGWFDRELESWADDRAEFEHDTERSNPGVVIAAVRNLARHPLFRHEAAELIVALLFERPELSVALCQALLQLGSGRAVPGLVDALSAQDADLRTNAWAVLTRLTGEELPADSEHWVQLVLE